MYVSKLHDALKVAPIAAHSGAVAYLCMVLPEIMQQSLWCIDNQACGVPARWADLIMASPPRQLTRLTMRKSSP